MNAPQPITFIRYFCILSHTFTISLHSHYFNVYFTTVLQGGCNYLPLASEEMETHAICAHHSPCSSKNAVAQVGPAHDYEVSGFKAKVVGVFAGSGMYILVSGKAVWTDRTCKITW